MAVHELPEWLVDTYAPALPRGHDFGRWSPYAAWGTDDGRAWGAVMQSDDGDSYGFVAMRRRVDGVWVLVGEDRSLT